MNIIDFLRSDHLRFIAAAERIGRLVHRPEIFAEGESAERQAIALLQDLMRDIRRHEAVERRLLFPELSRRSPELARLLTALDSEHREIDVSVAALFQATRDAGKLPAQWLAYKTLRFIRMLEDHILLEDGGILSKADRHIPVAELERLGREAQAEASRERRHAYPRGEGAGKARGRAHRRRHPAAPAGRGAA